MPIYEYRCTGCGRSFEQLMSSSSVKNPACPKCGKKTEKQLSTFSAKTEATYSNSPKGSCVSCCSGGSCGCH